MTKFVKMMIKNHDKSIIFILLYLNSILMINLLSIKNIMRTNFQNIRNYNLDKI